LYHVQISSCTRLKEDPAETAVVDESANDKEQADWVKATGFDKQTTSEWDRVHLDEKMPFDDITKEWDYGDHDSPIRGLGSIDCSFYFISKFPDTTKAFDLLDEKGDIQSFGVVEFNETEDEWKTNVRYVIYEK